MLGRLSLAFPEITFKDATTAFELQHKVLRCLDWVQAKSNRACLVEVNDQTRPWQQIVDPGDECEEGYLLFHRDSCFRIAESLGDLLPQIGRFLRDHHVGRCCVCTAPTQVATLLIDCPACSRPMCSECFDAAKQLRPGSKASFSASCPSCRSCVTEEPLYHRGIGFNLRP